jgi:uncharacterized protein
MKLMKEHLVWEWAERIGLEHLQLTISPDGIKAEGLVVADLGGTALRFRHSVFLEPDWRMRQLLVFVVDGSGQKSITVRKARRGGWDVDGLPRPDLDECSGFDIAGTPFLKTHLIDALGLEEGESREISVAHVDNRRLKVSPVTQRWLRLNSTNPDISEYRCVAMGETSELKVDHRAIVLFSLRRWRLVAGTKPIAPFTS